MKIIDPKITEINQAIDAFASAIRQEKIYFSWSGAGNPKKIELFEIAFGVRLPASFKSFLEYYDGGFIADKEAESLIMTDEFNEAKKLSTRILDIDEIIDQYENLALESWEKKIDADGFYPFIPFCITGSNEMLVFVDQYKRKKESGVFYARKDIGPAQWNMINDDFTEFLISYTNANGNPDIQSGNKGIMAGDYLIMLKGRKELADDPSERIKRNSAYLKLFPEDPVSYTSRGTAYADNQQYDKALSDFNKSLEINEESAFAHYYRGDMFLKIHKPRQALIDLDIACRLAPDDPFYLSGRADAFYQLNRMDEALADCNRAIEINNAYLQAYQTRYLIYLYLGEAFKAEEDAAMIDELIADDE